MEQVAKLLMPRIQSAGNASRRSGGKTRLFLLGAFGILFWVGIFLISLRVLHYFRGIEEIGDLLADKILSMLLITAFALSIFSSILTGLSRLYLSRDLFLVHSLPVSTYKIFIARFIDSTFESGWMVVVYAVPVLVAYGIVHEGGVLFYLFSFSALVLLTGIASAVSVLMVMIAVIFIPANRMKNVFVLLGILLFIVLYIAFRMLKPERFVDPEAFSTVLVYVKSLQTPSTPLLPSTWAFDAVRAALTGNYTEALFHLGLSVGFAGLIIYTAVMIADLIYFKGFSKTQTSAARLFRNRISAERLFAFLPGPIRAFTLKEIRTFLRDQAQWSQIFLIGALVVIYIYNFSVLPLDKSPIRTVYLQNLLSFLNMGLALFVLTAVTARFAYPAVSTETNAFWIVRTAPIPIKSYLKIKFFIYFIPLLILTEILIVATNLLLQVTPFMMALSTITVFCIVPGIVCMGIGLGAAYPDFKAENPMQTVTSFGGVLFMILCAGFIALVMILEAGPVQNIFFSDLWRIRLPLTRWLYILVSFAAVFCLCCLAVVIPMRYGERKLTKHPV